MPVRATLPGPIPGGTVKDLIAAARGIGSTIAALSRARWHALPARLARDLACERALAPRGKPTAAAELAPLASHGIIPDDTK
jgi:hypothetical protein